MDQRPGTASREEHKSAHMPPSPPQMPPPIALRIEKVLRQHTSRARSACPRQSSAIGQTPCLDGPDEPGIASSWKHNSKSEVGVWHADEGQEERQRDSDGLGSAIAGGHDSESTVCPDRSGDRKACLQESMRKWAEQASMREDKALDIARKSKAKRQREGGDTHRAWLDQKYLKRTLKRLSQQSSSTASAPGTASARAASEQASRLSQTRASNTHPGSARLESKGAASARSFNKDV